MQFWKKYTNTSSTMGFYNLFLNKGNSHLSYFTVPGCHELAYVSEVSQAWGVAISGNPRRMIGTLVWAGTSCSLTEISFSICVAIAAYLTSSLMSHWSFKIALYWYCLFADEPSRGATTRTQILVLPFPCGLRFYLFIGTTSSFYYR